MIGVATSVLRVQGPHSPDSFPRLDGASRSAIPHSFLSNLINPLCSFSEKLKRQTNTSSTFQGTWMMDGAGEL
jgi:hypothetical protein